MSQAQVAKAKRYLAGLPPHIKEALMRDMKAKPSKESSYTNTNFSAPSIPRVPPGGVRIHESRTYMNDPRPFQTVPPPAEPLSPPPSPPPQKPVTPQRECLPLTPPPVNHKVLVVTPIFEISELSNEQRNKDYADFALNDAHSRTENAIGAMAIRPMNSGNVDVDVEFILDWVDTVGTVALYTDLGVTKLMSRIIKDCPDKNKLDFRLLKEKWYDHEPAPSVPVGMDVTEELSTIMEVVKELDLRMQKSNARLEEKIMAVWRSSGGGPLVEDVSDSDDGEDNPQEEPQTEEKESEEES